MDVRPYNGDSFSQNITCSMYFNLREAETEGVCGQGAEKNIWTRQELIEGSEKICIMRNYVVCTLCQILLQ
jgi:hypothetical protein